MKIKSINGRGIRALMVTSAMIALIGPATLAQGQEDVEALKRQLEEAQKMISDLSHRVEVVEGNAKTGIPTGIQDDVNRRLDEIEDQVFEIEDRIGGRTLIQAFDAISLDIGGFLTQQFSVAVGEDNDEASFNATQFELLIKADITEDISLFTALGFLREADLDLSDSENPTFRDLDTRIPPIIA